MKLTKSKLKQIVREELNKALEESYSEKVDCEQVRKDYHDAMDDVNSNDQSIAGYAAQTLARLKEENPQCFKGK